MGTRVGNPQKTFVARESTNKTTRKSAGKVQTSKWPGYAVAHTPYWTRGNTVYTNRYEYVVHSQHEAFVLT